MSYDHSNEFESGDSMSGSSNDSHHGAKPKTSKSGTSSAQTPSSSAASAQHVCSYCGTVFIRGESKHMPFCSKRCQHIDLGMWLNESYGMPHEGESSLDSYGIQDEED